MPKFLPPNLSNNAELCILRYTTSDNEMLDIAKRWSGAIHTCNNGEWVVIFNEPIRMIGWEAFYGCSSLTSITIPSSVTEIEEGAFRQCCSLTSVTIPNSVIKIGTGAFFRCSSLTAFYGKFASADNRCLIVDGVLNSFAPAGLTKYTIPNSVTEIESGAFRYCISLTNVTIPNSVTKIGEYAFAICKSLTSVTIGDSVTEIESGAFRYCIRLTNVTIPNSVTKIGSGAFSCCSSLTSVTIPNSVTEIESGAFANCISLTAFYGKFASADNRCLIVDGVLNSFAPAGLTKYTIPNSVTVIGHDAFSGCSSLTSVTIPNSVTKIGSGAFDGCSSLTSVTIPNSVTEIGNRTFSNCSSLTSVYIPNSVTKIESGAFSGCSSSIRFYGKFASYNNRYLIGDGVIDTYNLSSRMTSGIFHKEEE